MDGTREHGGDKETDRVNLKKQKEKEKVTRYLVSRREGERCNEEEDTARKKRKTL